MSENVTAVRWKDIQTAIFARDYARGNFLCAGRTRACTSPESVNAICAWYYFSKEWDILSEIVVFLEKNKLHTHESSFFVDLLAARQAWGEQADIPYYVATMDPNGDRFGIIQDNAKSLGFADQLYPHKGFDGASFPKNLLDGQRITQGSFGCTMSHVGIWQRILNGAFEYAAVAEDDADFSVRIPQLLIDEVNKHDYHLVWLSRRRTQTLRRSDSFASAYRREQGKEIVYRPHLQYPGNGTESYLISKSGCRILLDFYKSNLFRNPEVDIDVVLTSSTMMCSLRNTEINIPNVFLQRVFIALTRIPQLRIGHLYPWLSEHRDGNKSLIGKVNS